MADLASRANAVRNAAKGGAPIRQGDPGTVGGGRWRALRAAPPPGVMQQPLPVGAPGLGAGRFPVNARPGWGPPGAPGTLGNPSAPRDPGAPSGPVGINGMVGGAGTVNGFIPEPQPGIARMPPPGAPPQSYASAAGSPSSWGGDLRLQPGAPGAFPMPGVGGNEGLGPSGSPQTGPATGPSTGWGGQPATSPDFMNYLQTMGISPAQLQNFKATISAPGAALPVPGGAPSAGGPPQAGFGPNPNIPRPPGLGGMMSSPQQTFGGPAGGGFANPNLMSPGPQARQQLRPSGPGAINY